MVENNEKQLQEESISDPVEDVNTNFPHEIKVLTLQTPKIKNDILNIFYKF